jgi:hypothetical protein
VRALETVKLCDNKLITEDLIMPNTAVGLFPNPSLVDDVVREIEALGFPQQEIRTMEEPANFAVTGVMSFPRLDYETILVRELTRIGTTQAEADTFVDGLRRGGALVLATGSDFAVDAAADLMDLRGAVGIEEVAGSEPFLAGVDRSSKSPVRENAAQAGRIRRGGGASCFVW